MKGSQYIKRLFNGIPCLHDLRVAVMLILQLAFEVTEPSARARL